MPVAVPTSKLTCFRYSTLSEVTPPWVGPAVAGGKAREAVTSRVSTHRSFRIGFSLQGPVRKARIRSGAAYPCPKWHHRADMRVVARAPIYVTRGIGVPP